MINECHSLNNIKCNAWDIRRGDNLVYVGGEMISRPFPRNAEESFFIRPKIAVKDECNDNRKCLLITLNTETPKIDSLTQKNPIAW